MFVFQVRGEARIVEIQIQIQTLLQGLTERSAVTGTPSDIINHPKQCT